MKREIEYYENKKLKRIRKDKIENMIKNRIKYNGKYIYIIPSNMRIDSVWYKPFILELNMYCDYIDYINEINEIRYYNTGKELGKELYYYIEV